MLIQLTNHCTMGCPHCMQESEENHQHMTEDVFLKTLQFGSWSGALVYNVSGGEPTEHPEFEKFMNILFGHLENVPMPIPGLPGCTVESNGEWFRDPVKTGVVRGLLSSGHLLGLQVSSFEGLYRNYGFIRQHKDELQSLSPKIKVVDGVIHSMQDLGRAAKTNHPLVKDAIHGNKYQVSCLNGCLIGKQTSNVRQMSAALFQNGQTCKPFVDWRGNVHWSESIGCPSYGNVLKDEFEDIWQNLRKAVPCGKCRLYLNLFKSHDPKIVLTRRILDIDD